MKEKKFQKVGSGPIAYFVTSNVYKFLEARNLFSNYKLTTAKINVKPIEIQNESLEEIAKFSALDAFKKCNFPLFVEDSGFFINSLNGFPGPYSKFVFTTVGLKGILKLMKNIEKRDAYFKSVIAFINSDLRPICFIGKVLGTISFREIGDNGFGYDPIFVPSKSIANKTFAEMTTSEKNLFSHRGKALTKFAEWFSSFNNRRF
jgi:XTP/dITP diphosphohydrolase